MPRGCAAWRGVEDAPRCVGCPGAALCGGPSGVPWRAGGAPNEGVGGARGLPSGGLRGVLWGAREALEAVPCGGGIWSALHCMAVQGMPWGLCYVEGRLGCPGSQGLPQMWRGVGGCVGCPGLRWWCMGCPRSRGYVERGVWDALRCGGCARASAVWRGVCGALGCSSGLCGGNAWLCCVGCPWPCRGLRVPTWLCSVEGCGVPWVAALGCSGGRALWVGVQSALCYAEMPWGAWGA